MTVDYYNVDGADWDDYDDDDMSLMIMIRHQGEGLNAQQLVLRGSEQWKIMTEEEKQPYVERSLR